MSLHLLYYKCRRAGVTPPPEAMVALREWHTQRRRAMGIKPKTRLPESEVHARAFARYVRRRDRMWAKGLTIHGKPRQNSKIRRGLSEKTLGHAGYMRAWRALAHNEAK